MKKIASTSTCIPICSSYECNSMNMGKSNFTIRYIPNMCFETKKESKASDQGKEKIDLRANKLP